MRKQNSRPFVPKAISEPTVEVQQSTTDPTVPDLERRLADLDAHIAERQRQAIDAEQAEAQASAQLEAAQGIKARVRFAAMVDEDPEAQAQLSAATDAAVRSQLAAEDWQAVKLDLAIKLRDLASERIAAVQDIARAQNAIDTDAACAVLSEIDAAAVTTRDAWDRFRAIRLRQVQRSVDANLPEGEVTRFNHYRPHERVFRWQFADLGLGPRPASHWGRDQTLCSVERGINGGGTLPDEVAPEQPTTIVDAEPALELH